MEQERETETTKTETTKTNDPGAETQPQGGDDADKPKEPA